MTPKFQKIYNTKINLDVDAIISQIQKTVVSQNIKGNILTNNVGTPFWQQYKSNICFVRNFYTAFPAECKIVADTLNKIKDELCSIDNPSSILKLFLKSTITPERVNLMKIPCGVTVEPHTDVNRSICINIGLKNSNSGITYVSDYQTENFWSNPTETFQMEDGDVYMLNVKKTHAVKYIMPNDSNLDRYIITYTVY